MCLREVNATVTGSGPEPVVAAARRSVEFMARPWSLSSTTSKVTEAYGELGAQARP